MKILLYYVKDGEECLSQKVRKKKKKSLIYFHWYLLRGYL